MILTMTYWNIAEIPATRNNHYRELFELSNFVDWKQIAYTGDEWKTNNLDKKLARQQRNRWFVEWKREQRREWKKRARGDHRDFEDWSKDQSDYSRFWDASEDWSNAWPNYDEDPYFWIRREKTDHSWQESEPWMLDVLFRERCFETHDFQQPCVECYQKMVLDLMSAMIERQAFGERLYTILNDMIVWIVRRAPEWICSPATAIGDIVRLISMKIGVWTTRVAIEAYMMDIIYVFASIAITALGHYLDVGTIYISIAQAVLTYRFSDTLTGASFHTRMCVELVSAIFCFGRAWSRDQVRRQAPLDLLPKLLFLLAAIGFGHLVPTTADVNAMLLKMDRIPKAINGVSNLANMLQDSYDYAADIFYEKIYGEVRPRDSAIPQECVENRDKAFSFDMNAISAMPSRPDLCEDANLLYAQYHRLRDIYRDNRVVKDYLNAYAGNVRDIFNKASASNPKPMEQRVKPVSMFLYGGSAVGKSNLINFVAADILKRERVLLPTDSDEDCRLKMNRCIYARAREQEFWDGYMNQLITVYDDVFQLKDSVMSPNLEFFELIRSVNTFPYPLHKADLSEKANSFFSSKFLFGTTNVKSVFCPSLNEKNAVLTRMHCNFAVRVKKNFRRSPGVAFNWDAVDQTPFAVDPEKVLRETGKRYSLEVYEIFEWDPRTGSIGDMPIDVDQLCDLIWNKHQAHSAMKEDATQMIMDYVRREYIPHMSYLLSKSDRKVFLVHDTLIPLVATSYLGAICGVDFPGKIDLRVSERSFRGDRYCTQWYFEVLRCMREDIDCCDPMKDVVEFMLDIQWFMSMRSMKKVCFLEFIKIISVVLDSMSRTYELKQLIVGFNESFSIDLRSEVHWMESVAIAVASGLNPNVNNMRDMYQLQLPQEVERQIDRIFNDVDGIYRDQRMRGVDAVRYVYERLPESRKERFLELALRINVNREFHGFQFVQSLMDVDEENTWSHKIRTMFYSKLGYSRALSWENRIANARSETDRIANELSTRAGAFFERNKYLLGAVGALAATLGIAYLAFKKKEPEQKLIVREAPTRKEVEEKYPDYDQYFIEELDACVVVIPDECLVNGQSFSISSEIEKLCFMTKSYFAAACEFRKQSGDEIQIVEEMPRAGCSCGKADLVRNALRETGPHKQQQQKVRLETGPTKEVQQKVKLETGPVKEVQQRVKLETGPVKEIQQKVKLETGPTKDSRIVKKFEAPVDAASIVRESWHSSQASELSVKIQDNFGWIWTEDGTAILSPVFNICGSYAILPHHYWLKLPDTFLYAPPRCRVGKYQFTKNEVFVKVIERIPGRPSDVALIKWPRVVPKTPNIIKNFVTKAELSELKDKRFVLVSPGLRSFGQTDYRFQYHFKRGTVTAINDGVRHGDGMSTWALDLFSADCASEAGDCGGIYVADENSIRGRVLAMHYAGGLYVAGAIGHVLVYEDFEQYEKTDIERQSPVGTDEAFDLPLEGVMPMYKVDKAPSQPTTSGFEPTPIKGLVDDTEMQPVTLGHILEPQGPGLKGLQKVTGKVYSLNPVILEKSVQSYSSIIFNGSKPLDIEKRVLSFDEAVKGVEGSDFVRGINRARSPGYPWMMQPGGTTGKRKWFGNTEWELGERAKPVRDAVEKKIEQCSQGVWEPVIFVDTLKDECRPVGKKTRVFSAGPMHFTIAFRMYFLGFVSFIMRNRIHNEVGVGIQAQSMDWHHLGQRLQRKGDAMIAGDFSDYDGNLHPEFLWAFCDFANRWYSDGNDLIRKTLFCDIVHSWHLAGSFVYGWTHSQPSGNPVTSIVNSVANSLMCRYVFYLLAREKDQVYNFNTAVQMISYGDDNVLNVREDVIPWFNQISMTEAFRTIGMTYTDANKEEVQRPFIGIDEVSFLKRGFRRHDDIWLGPLERKSINNRLEWQKRGMNKDTLIENGKAAIAEWALHDRKDFEYWKKRIQDVFLDKLNVHVEAYSQEFYIAAVRAGDYGRIFPGLEYI